MSNNTKKTSKELKYNYKQFALTKAVINVRFSPKDSKKVYYLDNTTKRWNIWKQEFHGSYPKQLTQSAEWSPQLFNLNENDDFMIVGAHYQGNELSQIFRLSTSGGIPVRLSKDKTKRFFPANNGFLTNNTLVITTDSLSTTLDVGILNLDSGEILQLSASDSNYFANEVSPDKKYIIITEVLKNTDNNLYLFDLESKDLKLLTPHENDVQYVFQGWDASSNGFYLTTNENREFRAGGFFDLKKMNLELFITPNWDVNQLTASKKGKWLVWTVNENGYDVLHIKNLKKNKELDNKRFAKGIINIQDISHDEKYIALTMGNSKKISDIHIFEIEKTYEKIITQNMIGGVDPRDMIEPELVSFSNGEFDIPAFLYKPKNVEGKIPIILSVHGGPESQERPSYAYFGLYQVLNYLGIGVLAPNIRGSTGYGLSYQKKIHRKWNDIYADIKACAEYMKGLPWVDDSRMGVFGGSFGGYATLYAVTKLPEYWKLGVDLFGVSNILTFVSSVPDFWKPMMEAWVGDPIKDKEMLEEASPINFIENIKADMLISQGANDPRVVKAESDQIVDKLKSMGRNVIYKVFEDEGHGFAKNENYLIFLQSMVEFVYERFFNEKLDLSIEDF